MDALTEALGSPSLPTAVLLAALLWAVIRLVETVVDVYARRSGWAAQTDPELLAKLDALLDHAADAHDQRIELCGYAERTASASATAGGDR